MRRPHYIGSASGYKGVVFQPHDPPLKKPWKAYLRHHGQYVCLGYFKRKEEAAAAHDKAARKLFGPKTYLNREHGCRPLRRKRPARNPPRQDPRDLLKYGLSLLGDPPFPTR